MKPTRAAAAIARGLNDSLKVGRTVAIKQMTNRYNIPRFELMGSRSGLIRMTAANRSNLSAAIFADAKRSISISKFRGLKGDGLNITRKRDKSDRSRVNSFIKKGRKFQTGITRSKPRTAVSFEIVKGQRKTLKAGFIARMKSGHIGVFSRSQSSKGYAAGAFQYREGKGSRINDPDENDTPIAEHYSFTLHKAMANHATRQPIETAMQSRVPDRVKYQLERELSR
jgi:hypothetical protein